MIPSFGERFNFDIKISGNLVELKFYETKYQSFLYRVIPTTLSAFSALSLKKTQTKIENERKARFFRTEKRARSRLLDLIACNIGKHLDERKIKQKTKFLTLTMKNDWKDLRSANRELTKFFKRLSYITYRTRKNVLKYVAVPELQKRGVWHFHIVIFNMKYVPFEKILKLWRLGGVYINAVKGGSRGTVAKYISKYLSKNLQDKYMVYKKYNLLNMKRYSCSRGLARPFVTKTKSTETDYGLIKKMLKKMSIGLSREVTYENEHRGKIKVFQIEVGEKFIKPLRSLFTEYFYDGLIKVAYRLNWEKIEKRREYKEIQEILHDLKMGVI